MRSAFSKNAEANASRSFFVRRDEQLPRGRKKHFGAYGYPRDGETGHIEQRPVDARNEKSIRGHVFVAMLARLIRRELERAWVHLDITVEEGLDALKTVCVTQIQFPDGPTCSRIPEPRRPIQQMLHAADVKLSDALPSSPARVVTRKNM